MARTMAEKNKVKACQEALVALQVEDLNELSLKQLECPICMEYCTPPIVQCRNGHNICSKCRQRIKICPVCKSEMTDVRNLFAEQISSRLKYPCKFASNGCKEKIVFSEMEKHVEMCSFVIRCQLKVQSPVNPRYYVECLWLGSHFELATHMVEKHKNNEFLKDSKAIHEFPLRHRIDAKLISAFLEYFWSIVVYNFKTCTMKGMVFCIGSKKKSSRFTYQYEICSEDSQSAFVHRGSVVSSHDNALLLEKYFTAAKGDQLRPADNTLFQGEEIMKRYIHADNSVFKCKVIISLKEKPASKIWEELGAN